MTHRGSVPTRYWIRNYLPYCILVQYLIMYDNACVAPLGYAFLFCEVLLGTYDCRGYVLTCQTSFLARGTALARIKGR